MKKFLLLIMLLFGMGNGIVAKSLVAYYSRTGDNYEGNLTVGNTAVIAKKIQILTQSDAFEIKTIRSYPDRYNEAVKVAETELKQDARPEIVGGVENMASYDTIYLGFPIWIDTLPMAVFTFLEKYDMSGKTVIPFATHGGGGLGVSEEAIKKLCPKSTLKKCLSILGKNAQTSDAAIEKWVKE